MMTEQLQDQCELGQQELSRTNYVEAEMILAEAEAEAWRQRDFDTLSRLYMPLQETRRQRRQRCGEGEVCLDLWAENEADSLNGRQIIENYPFGQLIVAGWGTVEPAREVRRLQHEMRLYVETFLGAVYPVADGRAVVLVPLENTTLPAPTVRSIDELRRLLPAGCVLLREQELPRGIRRGDAQIYAEVMQLWERLHGPFITAADAETDPIRRMEAYRTAIRVDYACELAHQKLADVARELARAKRG